MNSIDKTTQFTPTKEQQEKIDQLLNKDISGRIIGIDDALELIALAGTGYAAGHWAASEAHKRFGLSASNRWWWRAGISTGQREDLMTISMESKKNIKKRLRRFQVIFVLLMLLCLHKKLYILAFSFGVTSSLFYIFQKSKNI